MTGAKIRISLILHTGRLLFSLLLTSFVPWTFAKTSGVLLVCVDRSTCNRGVSVEISGRVLRDPHSLFASDRTAGRKSWMADGMNGRAVRADELTVRHRRCAIYDARMTAAGIRPAVYEHRTVATPMLRRRGQCVPSLCRSGTGRHKWRPYGRCPVMRHRVQSIIARSDELSTTHRRGAIYDARMTVADIRPAGYEHPDYRHAHAPPAWTMRPDVVPFRHRASQVVPLRETRRNVATVMPGRLSRRCVNCPPP